MRFGLRRYETGDKPPLPARRIQAMVRHKHPLDFNAQRSWLKRLFHSCLQLGRLATHTFTGDMVNCRKLKWGVANNPGHELIAQSFAFPEANDSREFSVWGDYEKAKPRGEGFHCEKP